MSPLPAIKLAFTSTVERPSEDRIQLYEASGEETPVSTFVPQNFERNYAYPLVVWLHGQDQNECDLPHVMRHVSTRNYLAVAPRGVDESLEVEGGYAWSDAPDSVEEAADRVFDALQQAQRFNINDRRVFLAGVGAGGTLAMRLAMRHPETFAGAATFDGALPTGNSPLGRVNELRSLPILLSSSRESQEYPEQQLCDDLRLLHSAGATVSVRQYPGGDDLTTAMLADFDRWMMEIVCGAAAAKV
ncbi:alpha/beta hydrolase [Posidoniimonas polymericola]|nr:alpha/beta hydrolase-fold protein [Posidoniimonas polymericola]